MEDKNIVSLNLGKLRNDLGKQYLYKAMTKACAIIRNDAIKNVTDSRTGELRRSIDFYVSQDGTEGVVYANVEYAPYVEVGTGIYSSKGNGRDTPWRYPAYVDGETRYFTTRGQPPQPFLAPALEQNTSKIKECFEGIF